MKENKVESIIVDPNSGQPTVEFKNKTTKKLVDVSSLSTSLQQALTQELKSTGHPITFSQISKEFDKKQNNDKAKTIGVILIIGIILAVAIGLVVYNKNKKRNY